MESAVGSNPSALISWFPLYGFGAELLEYEIYSLSFLVSFFVRTTPGKTK